MARRRGASGDRTAAAIRAAALRLFARDGFAAVSMRTIAAEVGVQVGTLYLYTPDKQSLLAGLMIAHLEDALADWEAAAAAPGRGEDPGARLGAFVAFELDRQLGQADAARLVEAELRSLGLENRARVDRLRRMYEQVLEDILLDGVAAGRFDVADPRLAAPALIALVAGAAARGGPGGHLPAEMLEAACLSMALGAVGAA